MCVIVSNAGHTDSTFVRLVFFFSGRRCPPAISVLRPRNGGPSGSTKPFQDRSPSPFPGLHLKIPRSGTLQDGYLTLRLANARALQGVRVTLAWRLSRWPIRPALVLGCLSSRGPLGPARGFYRARVRCLDVALLNCKSELGAIRHGRNAFLPPSPCFVRLLGNIANRLRACGTPREIMSLGLHAFAGLQVAFRGPFVFHHIVHRCSCKVIVNRSAPQSSSRSSPSPYLLQMSEIRHGSLANLNLNSKARRTKMIVKGIEFQELMLSAMSWIAG